MSKKKTKFKRQLKAQMMQEITRKQKNDIAPQKIEAKQVSAPEDTNSEINLSQIKYDLKKTGLTVAVLALIIAVLFFLDSQNSSLSTFGDYLFKILHIG